MRRGGCDVPVVAAAPLAFAVPLPRCEIKWMEVWRRPARRIPAASEPLERTGMTDTKPIKNASILQDLARIASGALALSQPYAARQRLQ